MEELNRATMKLSLSKQIVVITFFRIILNTGRRFVYPFAPALSRTLEVPLTAFTAVIAAGQFSSLFGLFLGPLADRLGYRLMMRSGLAMLAVGTVLCGMFPVYWVVLAGLVVASFGKTLFDPAVQAFIGQQVPYGRRSRAIGTIEMAWALSTLAAIPALGGIIERFGLRSSFFLLAVCAVLGWLAFGIFLTKDTPAPPAAGVKGGILSAILPLFKSRATGGMLMFGFFISVANDSIFVVYGAWFEQAFSVNIVTLGLSTIAIGSAELLGEFCTAMFSDRLGVKKAVMIGMAGAILAYLLLPFIGVSLKLAMVGIFLVFFFFEFTIVSSFSLCTELVPEARATMMAGYYAMSGLGRMAGVLFGGSMWASGGIRVVSFTAALFTLLGLVSLLWGLKGWKHAAPAVSSK
jgi:predicted MFS family arabinose efflux permease